VKHASLRADILGGLETNAEPLTEIAETVFARWARPIQGT
jgi:hypothetical protein